MISNYASFPAQMLWMVVFVSAGQFICTVVLTLWQVQVKPLQYGLFQIAKTLTNIGFSVILVVVLGMTWQGRIDAQIYSMLTFVIIGLLILWRNGWFKFTLRWDYIKQALNFGIPLVPYTLAGVIISMTDRFFITSMVGLAATGLYSVGYQIGGIINLFGESFSKAYVPWLYSKLKSKKKEAKYQIVRLTYKYFAIIIISAVILSIIAPLFFKIFLGKEFTGSVIYVVWIAIGYAFSGMNKMVGIYIFYAKKTHLLAWVTLLSAFLNIALNYILITTNGAIGAAQATLITYIIKFVLVWLLSSRVYKMPWMLKKTTEE